jgi:bacterial polymer biosynthesis proteins, WecB/TagA/CpsF family
MTGKRINFLSVPIDALSMEETVNIINDSIRGNRCIQHVAINASKAVSMQSDKELYESIVNCDIINADGQSIVWAARFLGKYLPERVAGVDLMENLVDLAFQEKYKCFFFGAKEEVVVELIKKYTEKYTSNIIAGYRNGYYIKAEEAEIARQIAESGANILFVAITSPKKEIFLNTHKNILKKINFTMGVGGSFDVIAGLTKRAPGWMQNIGLEWLFRLIQEPRRMWKRYVIGNFQFIRLILNEKYKKTNEKNNTYLRNPS